MRKNDWVTVKLQRGDNVDVFSGYVKAIAKDYFVVGHGVKNIIVFLHELLEFKIIEPYAYTPKKGKILAEA